MTHYCPTEEPYRYNLEVFRKILTIGTKDAINKAYEIREQFYRGCCESCDSIGAEMERLIEERLAKGVEE